MDYELLKLDNQLCFALYACSREITKSYKPFLDELGITYTQYVTLLVLWEQDCITVKDLGTRLHLDSGTLTPLLKKLEAMHLLSRLRARQDERNVIVKLTKDGIALKDRAAAVPQKLLCSTGIDPKKAVKLREDLKELLRTFE